MNKKFRLVAEAIIIILLGLSLPAVAKAENSDDEENTTKTEDEAKVHRKILVIGSRTNLKKIPGSAQLVTIEEIRQQNYDDINRALRTVPGVYVREEDGYGLFPNISLRGIDTTRSAKVTLMEDGIMIAPAPYSSPAAYYSPTTGRMSGLEVLKGSSQIKYGPHTTGGVINYLTTPIPTEEKVYLKSSFGSFNEQRTHAYTGNTFDTDIGQVGLLLEGYRRQNDGFKTIDETPDFRQGGDTGMEKTDVTFKLSWEPNTDMYQRLELKHGSSVLDANETYLGLTDADFEANPTRRYAASRFDNIQSEQQQTSLRHTISPQSNIDVISTLYQTDFKRNWYKLNSLNGDSLSAVLATPGLSQDCLKGTAACDLYVKANNRKYQSKGLESVVYSRFDTDNIHHEVMIGVRLHQDHVQRFQWEDAYTQAANGTISNLSPGIPGAAGDRFQQTEALALFIQDTIEIYDWTITPGLRYESLSQISEDPNGTLQSVGGSQGRDGKNSFDMTAIGIGAAYQFNDSWTGFGGVHTGFSPPSPRGTRSGLDPETSIAFEAGLRYANVPQALAAEATFFYTAFDDLVVVDNIGGAGSGDSENFGEVDSYGVEFAVQYDAGIANDWTLSNPYFLSMTYTNAEQQNEAQSTNAGSIFSFGQKGNKVPYIPALTVSLGTSLESKTWGMFLSANYVSETYASANNVDLQLNGSGDPDARFGRTDSYFVIDVSGFYRVSNRAKLFIGIQNVSDEEYIVSRQPHGARGGLPQFVYAGIEFEI